MNRLTYPVSFCFEPDVVHVFGRVTFGAAGAPTLDTSNSKGVCNFTRNSFSTTGVVTSGSAAVTGLGSLLGVYNSMTISGSGISGSPVISSVSPSGLSLNLASAANATGSASGGTLTIASVGQYTIQLGSKAGVNLDTYNKLLSVNWTRDEITNNAAQAGSSPSAPNNAGPFIVVNSTAIRTIPGTSTTAGTDASLVVQFGTGTGSAFVAVDPDNGSAMRFHIVLSRSKNV